MPRQTKTDLMYLLEIQERELIDNVNRIERLRFRTKHAEATVKLYEKFFIHYEDMARPLATSCDAIAHVLSDLKRKR